MSDRELMRIHVEALFTRDAAGRLVSVNEPQGGDAPRFFLGRTAEGSDCWFRGDVDDQLTRELAAEAEARRSGEDHRLAPEDPARYEALLERAAPIQRTEAGPAPRGAGAPGPSAKQAEMAEHQNEAAPPGDLTNES
jgi:hypothetical protein